MAYIVIGFIVAIVVYRIVRAFQRATPIDGDYDESLF